MKAALLVSLLATCSIFAVEPIEVQFGGGNETLHGFLWKPVGAGPFPAIVYNHGSEKLPGSFPPLGAFWTSHGFIFFVPHRHGHGRSPGEYIVDLQDKFRASETNAEKVQLHAIAMHERYNTDVIAAVEWLKTEPGVDANRLIVSGISYGGIQTKGKVRTNARMTSRLIRAYCQLGEEAEGMLSTAMTELGLSPRAYDRILKVGRTIADLDGADRVELWIATCGADS